MGTWFEEFLGAALFGIIVGFKGRQFGLFAAPTYFLVGYILRFPIMFAFPDNGGEQVLSLGTGDRTCVFSRNGDCCMFCRVDPAST